MLDAFLDRHSRTEMGNDTLDAAPWRATRCGYDGDGRDGEFRLLGFIEGFASAVDILCTGCKLVQGAVGVSSTSSEAIAPLRCLDARRVSVKPSPVI
jgi:hypothetical protein